MKSKNYLLFLVSGLVLSTQHSYAQKDSSGIYQTCADFQQRKLTYAINCKTEKQEYKILNPGEPLTIANIKEVYPDNHKLHDAFDAVFKEDRELYTYDNFHKMFKLNWILKNNGN